MLTFPFVSESVKRSTKKSFLDHLTSSGVVVGLVQVQPQVGQVRPDGGRGGVDAGDPFTGLQGGRRAPFGLPIRLGLAREVEELGCNSIQFKNITK